LTATSAIIPASGLGRRLSDSLTGKAFVDLAGRPLISYTIATFQHHPDIDDIVIVAREVDVKAIEDLVKREGFSKVHAIVVGGEQRQDSVRNGLRAVSISSDVIAIHDGARPLVDEAIISRCIDGARQAGAVIAAVPVIDTIKSSPDGKVVHDTPDRRNLYAVQTPQAFNAALIRSAHERAHAEGFVGTDDASLVERLGAPVGLVMGSYRNVKVTTPSDIKFAEAMIVQEREKSGESRRGIRVGHGYDIHRFAPGRELYLGGVLFAGEEGLLGHSDADVLLHAVSDALLGAAGAGDIGKHFPDTDESYRGAKSTDLLRRVGEVISELGWRIVNVDVTLIAQRPKVAKRVPEMCERIAESLCISADQVSVKATTAEGLGAIGEGLGIECHAVALLEGA
jgi:2-C-methyl-D-erythritol 4-phosphate cytidylyltransferase/2-C-methyl-D-erythritol 2,4-cyclodiphosphate synthase